MFRLSCFNHSTPAYKASKHGYTDIVKVLLLHKADSAIVNEKSGMTALSIACLKGHFEIVKLLFDSNTYHFKTKYEQNLLHLGSQSGNADLVNFILSLKIPINDRDSDGLNALHYACKGIDCAAIVTLLIEHNCDYLAKTKNISFYNWS